MSKVSLEGVVRLPARIQDLQTDCTALVNQIVKSSKSTETLGSSIKQFASLDSTIDNSANSVKKLGMIVSHMQITTDNVAKNIDTLTDIQDHLIKMEQSSYYTSQTPQQPPRSLTPNS